MNQLIFTLIKNGWHLEFFRLTPSLCKAIATKNVPVGQQQSHRRIEGIGEQPEEALS